MGIVINQSIKSSVVAYAGVLIGYINVLWLYTYFLSADQIGLFRLIQSSSFLLATFGQIGIGRSVVKFYPSYKNEKGFLSASLIGSIIGFIILIGITFIFQDSISSYFAKESALFVEYFILTLAITLALILFQVLGSFARSLLNIVLPTLLRDIGLRLAISIAVLLYGFDYINFDSALYLVLGAYIFNALALLFYTARIKKMSLNIDFRFLKEGRLKEVLRYGFYSLLGAGGTQIILQIDSVMVSGMAGLQATGVYTIAFFIGVVIEMPKRAITQVSGVLISDAFAKDDMAAVKKLYRQTSINQMIIGTLLLIGIWANIENVYSFIPNKEEYLGGMSVVLFIALGKLSDMIFGVNGEIIVMSKYYRFNVVAITLLALTTIVLNYLLIPIYGIEGAAIASFIAMLGFNVLKFLFLWSKYKLQPFTKQSLVFVIIALITLAINQLLPFIQSALIDLAIRSTIITFVLVGATYFLKVSEEFNQVLNTGLSKIGLKRI